MTTVAQANRILSYWFDLGWEENPKLRSEEWFGGDTNFDAAIRERFVGLHTQAIGNQMLSWYEQASTCLSLIVLLDQFPRNMYRGTSAAYASDGMALMAADHALNLDFDQEFQSIPRLFFYLPFLHSEDAGNQAIAVDRLAQFEADPVLGQFYQFALQHQTVIDRFGRFPDRNEFLGRVSTAEELAFLAKPESRWVGID
jgi:uncharacterized protein (DUF924 family)